MNETQRRKGRVRAILGTLAGFFAFNGGLIVGALVGLLRWNRRAGVGVGAPMACRGMLKMAGVKLKVVGRENMWAARPAIFVSNHQSSLDIAIVGVLLERDFTGVAKRSAKFDPRSMIAGMLIDPVFIDRANSVAAIGKLSALNDRIAQGISIMIWPEGTRSYGAEPGPFKKGAVHMAIQAGVPIVPIVLRNAGDRMEPGGKLVFPGTVDVAVLDPIPTDDWTAKEVGIRTKELRELFVRTLADWPQG